MNCDYLRVIRGTKNYNFTDLGGRFVYHSADGFGMASPNNLTERGPYQDGNTYLGYRLEERNIKLGIVAIAGDTVQHFENRERLMSLFKPGSLPIKLLYEYPSGKQRQIDTHYKGGLEIEYDKLEGLAPSHKYVVELVANDPTWYDPTEKSVTATPSLSQELVFPITFPIFFDSGAIDHEETITYIGNWKTYPSIVLTGPMESPRITNVTLDIKLHLQYIISAGETVTINLEYGNKSIENDSGDNLVGTLTTDSDITEFRIEADPDALNGSNVIKLEAGNATNVASMVISWYDRYIGV